MLDGLEMNDAVHVFYDMLEAAIADHIPRVALRRLFPPWFDASARDALRRKEAAFRRLRRNPCDETRSIFFRAAFSLQKKCVANCTLPIFGTLLITLDRIQRGTGHF